MEGSVPSGTAVMCGAGRVCGRSSVACRRCNPVFLVPLAEKNLSMTITRASGISLVRVIDSYLRDAIQCTP